MVDKMKKVLMVGLLSVASSAYSMETLIDFDDQWEVYGVSEFVIQNVTFSTDAVDGLYVINHYDLFYENDFSEGPLLDGTFQNNMLILDDGRQPLRFDFESAVSNFSFSMVGIIEGSGGIASNNWQLEVFNGLDEQIGSTLKPNNVMTYNGFSSSSENISYAILTSVNGGASDVVFIDSFKYAGVSPVPEPSTYALMLGGLGLVGFMAYRRKKVLS